MNKRIFIAADISYEAKIKIVEYINKLRNEFPALRVGWEKPEKMHLTLKFLGETDELRLEKLKLMVKNISPKFKKFKLRISNTGTFPNLRKPRVLWLGVVDESESLVKINQILETECEKFGFAKEKRKFKSHLTIGRIREPRESSRLAEKHLRNTFESVEFDVTEIVIYESQLQPSGSKYITVQSSEFGVQRSD